MDTKGEGVNMLDLRKNGQEQKVIKIQAHARGFLTRKHINEHYQQEQQRYEDQEAGGINRPSFNAEQPNYMNADVQNIRA